MPLNRRLAACAVLVAGVALAAEPLIESDTLPGDADTVELPRTRSMQPAYPKFPTVAPELEPPEYAGMVEAHNAWRRQVGVPELRGWSTDAARLAQSWAEQLATEGCQMRHSQNPERKQSYGENIYRYWRSRAYDPWARNSQFVVDAWGSEKGWYDAEDNTCMPPEGGTCGHYTAVVWDRTYLVGCGRAFCGDSEVWVCNYYPRGNYYGMRPFRYLASGESAYDLPEPAPDALPTIAPLGAPPIPAAAQAPLPRAQVIEAAAPAPPAQVAAPTRVEPPRPAPVQPPPVQAPPVQQINPEDLFGDVPQHDPLLPP